MNTNAKARSVQKTGFLDILFTDGSALKAKIYVPAQGRLSDVLNDERQFLPVETADGDHLAIAKSSIRQVSLPSGEGRVYSGNDPYTILGVARNASPEDLKKAYHQASMANHPDRIKGFGLGPDFLELATRNMVRINNAYEQILKSKEMEPAA